MPEISNRRLAFMAIAAMVAVAILVVAGSGGSSDESQASQGDIVKSLDPVTASDNTPSLPKTSWPGPNSSATESRETAEPSGTEASTQPCGLVSEDEAATILDGDVEVSEGLQGPTCLYSKSDSAEQVAIIVKNAGQSNLRNRPDKVSRVQVGDRVGWCLRYGASSVEVPLSDGRVLDVSGPCSTATRFAELALDRVQS